MIKGSPERELAEKTAILPVPVKQGTGLREAENMASVKRGGVLARSVLVSYNGLWNEQKSRRE